MDRWRRAAGKLEEGLYDELMTGALEDALRGLPDDLRASVAVLSDGSDLATIDAFIRSALDRVLAFPLDGHQETADDPGDAATSRAQRMREARMRLAEGLLRVLREHAPPLFDDERALLLEPRRLEAVHRRHATAPTRPKGSLQFSQLLTNAPGEALVDHLRSEFDSADRVDLLCAFLKVSGLAALRETVQRYCNGQQRKLRVLTTTYCGATELEAVRQLAGLRNVELRISYNTTSTRLHAKAWLFYRGSGLSTAYVGSSNLSHWAQTAGLEWNIRLTEVEQPQVIAQFRDTFQQYWEDELQFEPYDPNSPADAERLRAAIEHARFRQNESVRGLPFQISPITPLDVEAKDFQKPMLAALEEARAAGRHRNLLVAATGTGKTVMAALDFARLYRAGKVSTLLFVAHRREILEQARQTFAQVLRDATFGELLCDGQRPAHGNHVFASIQSTHERAAFALELERFDMVIVDEAHHAAASSWDALLSDLKPDVELLGLTATPERADGFDYGKHFPLPWIDNLRLWHAIPHALVPFRYYALDVPDVDLRDVQWRQGRYVQEELASKLTGAAEIFVRRSVKALAEHLGQPERLRALAFCSSIRHAEEVARRFVALDYKAQVLTGQTESGIRSTAREDLEAGRVQILCVVDLYNEGVDVPNVNTIFFFRPTESATVFVQQLGRGLRRTPTKDELVVFDLTGRQHHEFRFDRRLRALLGLSPRSLRQVVEGEGFSFLPSGCSIHFEESCRKEVLAQLQRSLPNRWPDIAALLREPAFDGLSLTEFLRETGLEMDDIYPRRDRFWHGLKKAAGRATKALVSEDEENALSMTHKLLHVGDAVRLSTWERLVSGERPVGERERRAMHMLFAVLYGRTEAILEETWESWLQHSALRDEIAAMIPVLRERNALLQNEPDVEVLGPDNPMVLHASYLGVELSAAFDHRTKTGVLRDYYTGVENVPCPGGSWDLLLTTLDKPQATREHLRYRDLPVGKHLFHWQSKARTSVTSAEGRRHLAAEMEHCTPLLLVRERADVRPGVTMAFQYLGSVALQKSEGERPISIEWKLRHGMPDSLLEKRRVAG